MHQCSIRLLSCCAVLASDCDCGVFSGIYNSVTASLRSLRVQFERIATEASKLARYSKKPTISSREIQTAVRFRMCLLFTMRLACNPVQRSLPHDAAGAAHFAWRACEARRVGGHKGCHQIYISLSGCTLQSMCSHTTQQCEGGETPSPLASEIEGRAAVSHNLYRIML